MQIPLLSIGGLVDRLLGLNDADDQVTGDHGLGVGRKVRVGAGLGRVDLNTSLLWASFDRYMTR